MSLTAVFGTIAVVSVLFFAWPQVLRLRRTRDAAGVSMVGALWALAGFSLWTIYGLDQHLAPVVAADGQAVVGFVAVLALAWRFGGRAPRLPLYAIGTALALCVAGLALPATVVGVTAILIGSTGYLPQARLALRGGDLTGISVATYAMIAGSGLLWITYGALLHNPIVAAPNFLIVPTAAVIAVRTARSRRRAVPPGAAVAPEATPAP